MKLTIDSSTLADAVGFAARAVNPRNSIPILTGVKLEAWGGELTISGFDHETANTVTVAADVEDGGKAVLPAQILGNILKALPNNKPLSLDVDVRANIKCGRTRFSTPVMPFDEYPALPAEPELVGVVDGHAFSRALEQVEFAVSRDDATKVLTGVKVEADGDTLTFFSTDRYRMAYADIPWKPADGVTQAEFLIKAPILSNAAKGAVGDTEIMLSDSIVGFASGSRRTTTALMAGDYPKVRPIFPAPDMEVGHCVVPTADLLASVQRAAVVIEGKNPVKLTFAPDEIRVDAGSGDSSTGEEAVDATTDCDERTVGFNPQYLAEALRAIGTENTVIGFPENPKRPVSIQEQTQDGSLPSARQIIMPIRDPR